MLKHSTRNSVTHKEQVENFIECLDDLFDVAHVNALSIMTIDEDKNFLLAQREKGRRGCMGRLDATLLQKHKRHQVSVEMESKHHRIAQRAAEASMEVAVLEDTSSSASNGSISDDEYKAGPSHSSPPSLKLKKKKSYHLLYLQVLTVQMFQTRLVFVQMFQIGLQCT